MDGKVIDGKYALTTDPSSTWPSIELYFDGFFLSIPPSVYFLKYKERNKPAAPSMIFDSLVIVFLPN